MEFNTKRQINDVFADHYFNNDTGSLHLGWMIDAYWTKVANKTLIPAFVKLYDALVANGYDDKNKFSWGDADGYFYYIPHQERMVMVYTSQSKDYLIVLNKNDSKWGRHLPYGIHIRRIWRDYSKGAIWDVTNKISNVTSIINNVDSFKEFNDNSAEYIRRPGLDIYAKMDYNLGEYNEEPRFYGDIRDPGYIISLKGIYECERAEGTIHSFTDLKYFADCYIQHLAAELKVEL